MCGICGFSGKQDLRLITIMCEAIKHRGPDQEGIFSDHFVTLGHRRLSIIDLSDNARQPLFNEDRSIALVYNGEIYNFRELRQELIQKGHRFISNTDSEVIVHEYEESGEECVTKFRGMFAFAIYDIKNRKLVLARDRVGIKPLYYVKTKERFIFASEIKAILQDPILPRQINQDGYNLYLAFQCIPDEETMFEGIKKLNPGHMLIFKDGDYVVKRYWDIPYFGESIDGDNSHDLLKREFNLLSESVNIRLVSDVPLGILLSGGLDSSSIVGLIKERGKDKIKTFTVGFNRPDDELSYARIVSRQFNTEHREFFVGPKDLPAVLKKIVWHMDEPLADGGAIATFLVAEELKKYVKVILVGEGGDEVFGGYRWHRLSVFPFTFIPRRLRERLYFYFTTFSRSKGIYNKFVDMFDSGVNGKANSFFSKMSAFEIKNILPNSLLMKVDKMTMAHSLEARVPFLDHKLIEFLFTVSHRADNKVVGKQELRSLMKDILPAEIVNRKKHGFILPVNEWLRNGLSGFCREKLLSRESHASSMHDKNLLKNLFKKSSGFREIEKISLLWRLLIFEIWNDIYIKKRI
jgi:asparagine synthase (glutamine-hydrolysing)